MLLLLFGFFVAGLCNTVYMTVLFCPTYFSTRGAVVAIDTVTGKFEIIGQVTRGGFDESPSTWHWKAPGNIFFSFLTAFLLCASAVQMADWRQRRVLDIGFADSFL
jgi:hypothetical protein